MSLPRYRTDTPLHSSFDRDIRDTHLIYDYDAVNNTGDREKWRYELWFFSHDRVVYRVHGGPMAGRSNYQTAAYQCIRPGELWQINWLEETGTVVSLVYDLTESRISGLLCFSQGHWENAKDAKGDKRNSEDFERWRNLAAQGKQTDRFMLTEQAQILQKFKGQGDLVSILPDAFTF
ncbi:Calycin-like protein [Camillea tinctor]|nr:Calycin-like protein [Camillea tinctor]